MYYIGLYVHKKTISYCVKDFSGQVHQEGKIGATRHELEGWIKTLPQPWTVAMEATIFTGWIYDHLLGRAAQVKVAHPLMLRAIAAAKKKNDRVDAAQDCRLPALRLPTRMSHGDHRHSRPARHPALPTPAGPPDDADEEPGFWPLMKTGVTYNKQRVHKVGYFREVPYTNKEVMESIRPLLKARPKDDRPAAEDRIRTRQLCAAGSAISGKNRTAANGSRSRTH